MYVTIIIHNELGFTPEFVQGLAAIPEEWRDIPIESYPANVQVLYYQGLTEYILDNTGDDQKTRQFVKHLISHIYPLGYSEHDIYYFTVHPEHVQIVLEV